MTSLITFVYDVTNREWYHQYRAHVSPQWRAIVCAKERLEKNLGEWSSLWRKTSTTRKRVTVSVRDCKYPRLSTFFSEMVTLKSRARAMIWETRKRLQMAGANLEWIVRVRGKGNLATFVAILARIYPVSSLLYFGKLAANDFYRSHARKTRPPVPSWIEYVGKECSHERKAKRAVSFRLFYTRGICCAYI